MEEKRLVEETKTDEHLMTIMITMKTSLITEKESNLVACYYNGGWLVLRDKFNGDCSILNVFTMEKLQLPSLVEYFYNNPTCILSSSDMDGHCRVIFMERELGKFWSCNVGDSEYIKRELRTDGFGIIRQVVNFKGKLYGLIFRNFDLNLIVSEFSDPELRFEQVVGGESIRDVVIACSYAKEIYMVESCDDLLLIVIGFYDDEVSDVFISRADFCAGEWQKLETLGDRAIFLDSLFSCSSPASAFGLKGNALYWFRTHSGNFPYGLPVPGEYLYMYDIEDKSSSSVSWLRTCNDEKKPREEQKDSSLLFEAASPIEIPRNEETKTIGCSIIEGKESLWDDVPTDLLPEIFQRLFAGGRVAFRSVCRSWYSVSPPCQQQWVIPLLESSSGSFSSPLLICPGNKAYDPIFGELYSVDYFPDEKDGKVGAARDGWLLMAELCFYNPLTTAIIELPECNAQAQTYCSLYFSAAPTSTNCLVVVAAMRFDKSCAICFMKCGDEGWTCREISEVEQESFHFSSCNAVVHKGLYYFLGKDAKLLVFDPEKDHFRVIGAPEFISNQLNNVKSRQLQQYILESDDGKLLAVFVGTDGSSVFTCEWNVSTSKWEILENLGNRMLFVSRPLSLCKRATVSGTGNKIYFPRVNDCGHTLFYSLATRKYHTFEMGTTYANFSRSKFYPQYNGWFMP